MTSMGEQLAEIKSAVVKEVPAGSTTVLNCLSNDLDHNFMFWLYNGSNLIGPGNTYDEKKYKYEVLSGKLYIHDVSPKESGYYHCVSRKLSGIGYNVGQVDMIVTGSTAFSAMDAVKLVAIVLSIIVIIGCAVLYYNLRKDWRKYDGATIVPVDEIDDDDDGGEDVYNATTTTINQSTPVPGPSRHPSSEQFLYGIDNQGLVDTDFNSVFENIQIKSPQGSLI